MRKKIMVTCAITFAILNVTALASTSAFDIKALDAAVVIEEFIIKHADETAGVAIAIAGKDEIIFQNSFGYADIENLRIADNETLYEWGSVSRLLDYVSIMQLYEQGRIDLETDINTYLPENFLKRLQYSEPITIIHLLHSAAGWQEVAADMRHINSNALPDLQGTLQICEPLQIHVPGTIIANSYYSIAMAGYIVERISGIPFYEYVADNIFAPLSMDCSSIHPTGDDNGFVLENQDKMRSYTDKPEQNTNYRRYHVSVYQFLLSIGRCSLTN